MTDYMTTEEWTDFISQIEDNISETSFAMDGSQGMVAFSYPSGWNLGLDAKEDTDLTDAKIGHNDKEWALTKEAALACTSAVGLPVKYVMRTPGPLVQSHMNFWATHSPDMVLKMLTRDSKALAVTHAGIVPFSNYELATVALDALGEGVVVDHKSSLSINLANHRLVSDTLNDGWASGVQIRNSLTGKVPLSVSLYLHNAETGDSIVVPHNEQRYNRKIQGQDFGEVMLWVGESVEKVLEGALFDFELLEMLTKTDVGPVSKVMADIFKNFKVPLKARAVILDNLVDAGDTTYYGVVTAIAKAASLPDLPEHFVTALMTIAGHVAHSAVERCESCMRLVDA